MDKQRLYQKKYREAHKEQVREYQRKYRDTHDLSETKRAYNNTMVKCDICHLDMKKLCYNKNHQCIAGLYGWEMYHLGYKKWGSS
jgi:hypothetical protein